MDDFVILMDTYTSSDCSSPNVLLRLVEDYSRLAGVGGSVRFGVRSGKIAGRDDEGTIMVDALVAVVIISLMIAMCMSAIHIAGHAWRNSRQTRQAQATLARVIDSTPRRAGQYSGVRDGFRYRVSVDEEKTPISRYCLLHAEITSGRTFSLDAARWCDRAGAA